MTWGKVNYDIIFIFGIDLFLVVFGTYNPLTTLNRMLKDLWCIWTLNWLQLSNDITGYHIIGDFLTKEDHPPYFPIHVWRTVHETDKGLIKWKFCCLGFKCGRGALGVWGPGNVVIRPGCSYAACVLIKLYHSTGKQSFGLQDKLTNKQWLGVLTLFCLILKSGLFNKFQ